MAPKITAMGRKIRMARKEYDRSKNEWAWRDLMKQDYMLREDFIEKSEKLGIKNPESLIGMLSDGKILGIKNKNLMKFQKDHGSMMGSMHENGLMAKKYLSGLKGESALSRYSRLLEKEGVDEIDESLSEKINTIYKCLDSGIVFFHGENLLDNKSRKFISENGRNYAHKVYFNLKGVMNLAHLDVSRADEITRDINQLKSYGDSLYIARGKNNFFSLDSISPGHKVRYGFFSAHNHEDVKEGIDNLSSSVEVGKDFLRKLSEINEANKIIGIKKSNVDYLNENFGKKRIFADKYLKRDAEDAHGRLMTMIRGRYFE
jgi:hypothetical protein